jgi:hypothetical protein
MWRKPLIHLSFYTSNLTHHVRFFKGFLRKKYIYFYGNNGIEFARNHAYIELALECAVK